MASGVGQIAVTVFWPEVIVGQPVVIFAFPGGGYARGYFDLQFAAHEGYSQAAHHIARGFILVAVDHLGVGASTIEVNDELRIEDIADANHQAVTQVLQRFKAGTVAAGLPPITPSRVVGTGQSMGGGVTIIMQGRHRTFDAIAPMGYSAVHTSLPQRDPGLRELGKSIFASFTRDTPNSLLSVPATAREMPDFLYPFFFEDVPADIVEADVGGGYPMRRNIPPWGSATVPRCVVGMMGRGYVAPEAASIDVPVFMGFGERDVAETPVQEAGMFPQSRDVTIFVVPRMAHMHNFASTRRQLWDRSADWIDAVQRGAAY